MVILLTLSQNSPIHLRIVSSIGEHDENKFSTVEFVKEQSVPILTQDEYQVC